MAMVAEAGGPQGHGRLEEPRRTLSRSVRGSVARQHLDLGLLASRAMRAGGSTFPLLSAPTVCGGPRKLIQMEMFLEN